MAKNPDLRTALACAKQVISDNTAYSDDDIAICRSLIVEMYDLDYTGIPEIVDKVLTSDLDADGALKVIRAMKEMYSSAGNGES